MWARNSSMLSRVGSMNELNSPSCSVRRLNGLESG
jgi:hypothetical protein